MQRSALSPLNAVQNSTESHWKSSPCYETLEKKSICSYQELQRNSVLPFSNTAEIERMGEVLTAQLLPLKCALKDFSYFSSKFPQPLKYILQTLIALSV